MKKRVLALLLCVCLVALMVPPLPAQAAVNASDAQAYLDILDRTKPTNSYLIDFDGDGRDELLTSQISDPNDPFPSVASYSVYQGNQALLVDEPSLDVANLGHATICFNGGKYYIGSSYDVYSTVQNGKLVDVYGEYLHGETVASLGSDPWLSEEELASIEYIANGQRVSEDEYYRQCKAFQPKFSILESGDVRPQLEAILQAEALKNASPDEILAQIPYYGDRNQCRLTPAQVEQLASTLENWSGETEWTGTGQFRSAYLCDGDSSGLPALVIFSQIYDNYESDGWLILDWLDIYSWDNGSSLTKHSLSYSHYGAAGHDYASFGRFSDGTYGWTSEYMHMGGFSFQAFHMRGGAWAAGTLYDPQVVHDALGISPGEIGDNDVAWNEFMSAQYEKFDELTKPERLTETLDYTTGASRETMLSLLRAYASANLAPVYPQFTDILGTGWESEPVQAASAAGGDVVACYSLTDGMCYVILQTEGGYRGVLVQASRQKGQVVWTAVRTDAEPTDQETLAAEVSRFLGASNVTVDFGRLRQGQSANELAEYLRVLLADMTGKGPNDLAKSDLAAFVDGAVSSLTTRTVKGKKNVLRIGQDVLSDLSREGRSALETLGGALENNGVTLNKTLTPTVRALWEDVDLSKPCQLELDREAARALEDCDLQLLLGDARTYLRVAAQDLTTLARDLGGSLRVQFSREDEGVYAIRFLNADGEVVDQLSCPVTVSLPAGSALDTIMVSYAGGSDNWGGQYDPAAGAISFDARYSGQYEVLENNVAINDIGALSEESRAAISFMVSKGYLGADNGAFRPGEPLTRYEFTEALVGMFFALDRELTTDFPDVEPTSRYYPYVASAQAKSIVNGYDNGTFSGDDPINREQVFALAARTLMEQKGYAQPADSEVYLSSFNDRSELSPWAAPQVALAVREGIAGRGAVLLPKANITREQAAVVLYRLFQLLYEVSPVSLELPGGGGGFPLPAVIGIGAGALAMGGVAVAVILLRKKKQTPVG